MKVRTRGRKFLDPNIARKEVLFTEHLTKRDVKTRPPFFALIEFNLTGLCNRLCVFCPRINPKVFPNTNEHIPIELYEKIMRDLQQIDYNGTILYSAFSEPLLYKNVELLIDMSRRYCPDARTEINCNGDFVTPEKLRSLFAAGLSTLTISMYDGPQQVDHFETMRREVGLTAEQLILRIRWLPPEEHFGITLSNRAGTVEIPEVGVTKLKKALKQRCHYPFYQTMIDYDGSALLCPHDWGKQLIAGNLWRQSIQEVWEGPTMKAARLALAAENRNFPPCNVCDVDGTLNGQGHFDQWMEHYRQST